MMLRRWTAGILFALLCVAARAQSGGFEFAFWPGHAPESDPRYVRTDEHPCGKVVIARVSILPDTNRKGAFEADKVLEVDASERIVRQWRMPVDSYPIAFRDQQLIFRYESTLYAVDSRGRVNLYTGAKPPVSPLPENCKKMKEFEGSDYEVCQALIDMRTGKSRLIRFQYPCT